MEPRQHHTASPIPSELLAAARRYHLGTASAEDGERLAHAGWQALGGGSNNGVYAFRHEGQPLVLKCFRVDERDRAGREWRALELLQARGGTFHPRPVAYAPHHTGPVVVMARIAGRPVRGQPLSPAQLHALVELRRACYAITPSTTAVALPPVVGNVAKETARLEAAREALRAAPAQDALAPQLAGTIDTWLAGPDPARLAQPAPPVFSAGDGNLANYLWDGRHLWRTDYEYSGWSDRAVDLADLVEHDGSRATPDDAWTGFVGAFDLSPAERARFQAARRLWAVFWAMLFWSRGGHDPASPLHAKLLAQLPRAWRLLAAPSPS
ncbi:MAG TPA: aminoglycoside phosphotransferase family protein [Chloroflexota bacterium]|nr:aminoglycoside phosphotransferase family protein [Chloroflexota bacterium]